ncbi:hypothetical protein HCH_04510 [Hahella chejuensis KCTC 2396]|uniref:Uncharacterized protein n=1 Tax=Hahella chejuensis (strain KCTC 2396) TaxID=349521 RepID=Q2SDR3_HAHCH|nr:hypothetical protein HCH_04510 [Hahella chejuensis KCTC 2396]
MKTIDSGPFTAWPIKYELEAQYNAKLLSIKHFHLYNTFIY